MVTHELDAFSFIHPRNFCNHYLAEGSFASFDELMLVCSLLSGPWFQLLDHLENWDYVVYSFDYYLLFKLERLTIWMHLGSLYWEKALDHSLGLLFFSWQVCWNELDLYNCPKLLKQPTYHEDYLLLSQFFPISRLSLGPNQHSRKVDFSFLVCLGAAYFCTRTFDSG